LKQKKLIDTGAGFYLDEDDLIEEQLMPFKETPRMSRSQWISKFI
jgi:hypothetical protein